MKLSDPWSWDQEWMEGSTEVGEKEQNDEEEEEQKEDDYVEVEEELDWGGKGGG